MALKVITAPTVRPIDVIGLDRVKDHLHEAQDVNEEDELITEMVNAAWALAEAYTWRQFLTADLELQLWNWNAQDADRAYSPSTTPVLIPRPNTQEILSVTYTDCSGSDVVLESSDFDVDEDAIWKLFPAYGKSWPSVRFSPKAVRVRFRAGYGLTLEEMPSVLMHAIKLQVGSWFLNRESVDFRTHQELPEATRALLQSIEIRDPRLNANQSPRRR